MNVDTILEDKKYFRQNSKRKQGEENTTIERERERVALVGLRSSPIFV